MALRNLETFERGLPEMGSISQNFPESGKSIVYNRCAAQPLVLPFTPILHSTSIQCQTDISRLYIMNTFPNGFNVYILCCANFRFNKTSVADGIGAVLTGEMDAFIYDGTVLDYLVSQVIDFYTIL